MSDASKWSRREFSKYLQNIWRLDIKISTLETHEREGLLFPEESKNNYKHYFEKDILEVFKIYILNKNLGIKHGDIRRIEGIDEKRKRETRSGNLKPVYVRNKNMEPEHLLKLLDQPELRLPNHRPIIFEKIVVEINEYRRKYGEKEWYSKIDWHDLYKKCETNLEIKEPLKPANFEQIVESIINKIEIRELIDEVIEELKDEFYYDVAQEIEERYELEEEYDEETADSDIIEAFEQELDEWIEQYEEEAVLEKMEKFVDEEVARVIQELLCTKIHDDVHYIFPELKEAVSQNLNKKYLAIRDTYADVLREVYEAQQQILKPIDMQLISILFTGDPGLYYIITHNGNQLISEFIEKHYTSIKACSKYLTGKYSEHMNGSPTLFCIPGGVKTVLEEVETEFPTIPIYYKILNPS
jgi:DNA-binding transcriptional MerR regulator